jgi:2-dehydro-3-deoxygluconokinase
MAASPDLVSIGEPLVEFSRTREGDGRTWLQGFGGDTSNAAIAAARQGARVGYITGVGADMFGDAFLELWRAEGVDTSEVRRDADAFTGVNFIRYDDAGHHFAYIRRDSAASRGRADDATLSYVRGARMLHVSGISQAISDVARESALAAMDAARKAGARVSYDTNLRLRLWPLEQARETIHAAIRMADIALPSVDDSQQLTGLADADAIVDFYLGLGPSIVALKLGPEGALVATREQRRRIAGYRLETVDATGAGDTFGGSFLARLLAGDDPFAAARYANAAAALSTTGYGAVGPIPRREAVLALLARG